MSRDQLRSKSRKEEKTKNGVARCHTVDIKYIIFAILSWFHLAWLWPEWLTPIFISSTIKQNRSRNTFYLLISFEEIKNSLLSGHGKTLYQKPNNYTWFRVTCNEPSLPHLAFSFVYHYVSRDHISSTLIDSMPQKKIPESFQQLLELKCMAVEGKTVLNWAMP